MYGNLTEAEKGWIACIHYEVTHLDWQILGALQYAPRTPSGSKVAQPPRKIEKRYVESFVGDYRDARVAENSNPEARRLFLRWHESSEGTGEDLSKLRDEYKALYEEGLGEFEKVKPDRKLV